jgi:tetratricopeptide (TPR) repeat protein
MDKPTIFISYSHKDEHWKDKLNTQLGVFTRKDPLAADDILTTWDDRRIDPGEDWPRKIQEAIDAAGIAVLLISANFLTSDFIMREEVPRLLERQHNDALIIFPIIVEACNWQVHEWLKPIQVLPKDAKPLEYLTGGPLNEALATIAGKIYEKFQQIVSRVTPGGLSTPDAPGSEAIEPPRFTPLPVEYVDRRRKEAEEDDAEGDLVKFLREKLSPGSGVRLMVLGGFPGMGKTASAQEAVKALQPDYRNRVVWVGAQGDRGVTFSEVVDKIIRRLRPKPDIVPPANPDERMHLAQFFLREPALVIIDDLDTMPQEEQQGCIRWLIDETSANVLLISLRDWDLFPDEVRTQIDFYEKTYEMTASEARTFWDRLVNKPRRAPKNKHILVSKSPESVIEDYGKNPFILYKGVYMIVQREGWRPPEEVLLDEDIVRRVFLRYFEVSLIKEEGIAILLALSLFTPHASREALMKVAGIDDRRSFKKSLNVLVSLELISLSLDGEHYELDKTYLIYAREHLKGHQLAGRLRERFVEHYVDYVEEHQWPSSYDAIEAEKENVFEALRIAADEDGNVQSLMQMMGILGRLNDGFFQYRGHWDVGLEYGDRTLKAAREKGNDDEESLAHLTCFVASLRSRRGEYEEMQKLLLPLVGDEAQTSAQTQIDALHILGMAEFSRHNYPAAEDYFKREMALSEEWDDQEGLANVTQEIGRIVLRTGRPEGERLRERFDEARGFFERSLAIRESLKNKVGMPKSSLHNLGLTAHQQGEWELLLGNESQALELYAKADYWYDRALRLKLKLKLYDSAAHTYTEMGELERLKAAQESSLQERVARYTKARELLMLSRDIKTGQADELHIAYTDYILGRVALDEGDLTEARERLRLCRGTREKYKDRAGLTGADYLEGLIAERQGDKPAAARLFRQALGEWLEMRLIAAEFARVALARVSEGEPEGSHKE